MTPTQIVLVAIFFMLFCLFIEGAIGLFMKYWQLFVEPKKRKVFK